jgi:acetylornithine deacetylase/succinyl-diaminopimelate desuccinylase-like protein
MTTRDTAISTALGFFDAGSFRDRLAGLVAIPSTLQDDDHLPDVWRYLQEGIAPWVERMGFSVVVHPNPVDGFGPILVAERIEDPSYRTVLTYGHGDTVRGLDDQWDAGLKPWELKEVGDRWYGRGTADNKGQHVVNLTALEHVIAARGGKLGFNVKLILETSEERGSTGLREFVAGNTTALAADVPIADGADGMAEHDRGVDDHAAPIARMHPTRPQRQHEIEMVAAARASGHGRDLSRHARPVRGDQHIGRQRRRVAGHELAQPG